MIKIQVTKKVRNQINANHRKYIELTSVSRLEEEIKRIRLSEKREFFERLFGNTPESRKDSIIHYCVSANLKDILQKFNDTFLYIYGFEYSNAFKKESKQIIKGTREELDKILNYREFNKGIKLTSGKKWSRHEFIKSLGIRVCPYCNRQYITFYEDEVVGSRTTADADHYYPKSDYPILQMNIFNLIPSCSVCNSRMKGISNKRHLYPYEDPSDSLLFEVPLEVGERVSEVLINTKGTERAEASVDVFKLNKIYQAHLAEASEVKERAEKYFEFNEKAYEVTHGFKVPFNIFSTWFDFMGKDISAEPLIKLRQDIFNQLNNQLKK